MTGPVLFCGDTHRDLQHILRVAEETNACAVILLGDIQSPRPLHIELAAIADKVWFIHGNHDTDTAQDFEHLWGSELAHRNLHGKVVVMPNGLRVAGLGGVFRQAVWYPQKSQAVYQSSAEHARATPRQDRWHGGPHRKHWSSIYPETYNVLASQSADVLVTHEAPGQHPHGFGVLDALARVMGVEASFHGHQHEDIDYPCDPTKIGSRSYGVGLRGIRALSGQVLQTAEPNPTKLDEPC